MICLSPQCISRCGGAGCQDWPAGVGHGGGACSPGRGGDLHVRGGWVCEESLDEPTCTTAAVGQVGGGGGRCQQRSVLELLRCGWGAGFLR
jgi:hypothetical protein